MNRIKNQIIGKREREEMEEGWKKNRNRKRKRRKIRKWRMQQYERR